VRASVRAGLAGALAVVATVAVVGVSSAEELAPYVPPTPASGAVVAGTPCTESARACVDISEGRAWLLDGGEIVRGPVGIMSGDAETPTPRGTFAVQWKAERYTSREFGVEMPYSVFFAEGGIAFHEGTRETPSAGCVKLSHEDAKTFFEFLQVGDQVQVH
jgi:Uncharacterized protein conserved in bacteria